ncbi:hypothetical protein JCM33374_g1050 [Metschnikowia sp. JCM 33374]|nr:hypothetical protein JCM33374_g1050 [Metschnikowia sp. JCM 33374]
MVAVADDISSVKAFFRQLHTNLTTLNPLKHNVYSVSESSFQWDPVASLTSNDAKLTIDFNDDYVTVFECINGEGNSLPPFMGPFDVQNHGDFKAFPKGWTRDKLRLEWLRYFIRLTNGNNKPQRFLIVDEHKGRPTEKFKTLCQENNVVLVCIPSTVWYHFVKLDVGASRAIKQFHRDRIGSISSIACLVEKYVKARSEALTRLSIRRKFCCTGLIEFNPERILNNLSPLKTCGNVDSDLEEIVTGPKEAENSVKEIDSGPKEAEDSVEEIYSGPEQIQDSDPEAVRDSDLEEIEYSDIAEIQHPDPISGPIQEQDPPCAEMDGETLSFPQKLHFIDPLAPCTHAKEPPLLQSVDGPTLNYQYPLENENISSNKEQAKPTQTFPRLHPNTNIQFFHHCDSETNY